MAYLTVNISNYNQYHLNVKQHLHRKSKGRLITLIFIVYSILFLKLKINKPQKAVIKFMKAVFKYLEDWECRWWIRFIPHSSSHCFMAP